jgi:hypothetical protein
MGCGKKKFRNTPLVNNPVEFCRLFKIHIFFNFLEMMDNLNLSTSRVQVNCQIRKFKITKLKQQTIPTYCHINSTDVSENHCMYLIFLRWIEIYQHQEKYRVIQFDIRGPISFLF